ncbi:MAG: ribosome biogenesis GTP-binding protein YsxC [Alphaproteobacteria bacterium]|nr:ribosome biogenesis GTP-binding protein YsxC [Alphaproteobacteria bacterium]
MDRVFGQPPQLLAAVAGASAWPREATPEVAFAGRSNVGKSSLLNALVGHSLARTSRTPGSTKAFYFYAVGPRLTLVDLPGYGYAQGGSAMKAEWRERFLDYARDRRVLRRILILVDARRGLMDSDRMVLDLLGDLAVSTQLVATKVDLAAEPEREALLAELRTLASAAASVHPVIQWTAAPRGLGIAALRADLSALAA